MCAPGGYRLTKPDYGDVFGYTQTCSALEYGLGVGPSAYNYDWPPEPCAPPCIVELDCDETDVPSEAAIAEVKGPFPRVEVLPTEFVLPAWTGIRSMTQEQEDFIYAALALLRANEDLVVWAVCLAAEYSPYIPTPWDLMDWFSGAVYGGAAVYTVADLDGGATGGGTNLLAPDFFDTHAPGAVIPILMPFWQDRMAMYQASNTTGRCKNLCALLNLCGTILHEWMHVAALQLYGEDVPALFSSNPAIWPLGDTVADDCFSCWAVQNMLATSFAWALAQRYPGLRSVGDCCPQVRDDRAFLSSEPGGSGCEPWSATPRPRIYDTAPACCAPLVGPGGISVLCQEEDLNLLTFVGP